MIEIETAIASSSQANVDDMVGTRNEANKSGHQEHNALRGALGISDRVDAHYDQNGSDDQQDKGGQHGSPVLAHLRMAPAIGVDVGGREVAVFLDERVAVPGRRVVRVL